MIPLFLYADSSWDNYTLTNPASQQFIRQRYSMISGYTPWFDPVMKSFCRDAAFYQDSYAIYNNVPPKPDDIAVTHPDWIMLDKNGAKLFIPYGFANGTYPQFAADISNENYIQDWIGKARNSVALGYTTLLIDDVNLEFRVSDINGAVPQLYGQINWPLLFVEFMEGVRKAFPNNKIIHNSIWFTTAPKNLVDRQILACDFINCERGFGDPNLNPATFSQFCTFIDHVHFLNRNVIQDEMTKDNLSFKVACFLLMYKKGDMMCIQNMFPDVLDPLVDTDLGSPTSDRFLVGTIWQRNFEKGYVTVDFTNLKGTVNLQ